MIFSNNIIGRVVQSALIVLFLPCATVYAQPILLEEVYTVGGESAPPEEVFGSYQSTALSSTGTVFIGDAQFSQIRVFDSSGKYVNSINGSDQDNGKFGHITSMALAPDESLLYVYDVIKSRVTVFCALQHNYIRHLEPAVQRGVPYEIYAGADGSIYFVGNKYGSDYLVHRHDRDGHYIYSFAQLLDYLPLQYDNDVVRMQVNRGFATVLDDGDLLIALAAPYRLARYSPAGEQRWLVTDPILPNPWEGYIEYSRDTYRSSIYPQVVRIFDLGPDHFIVPVYDIESSTAIYHVRNTRDGSLVAQGDLNVQQFLVAASSQNSGGLIAIKDVRAHPSFTVSRWTLQSAH